jgi:ferrous iron transport protein B
VSAEPAATAERAPGAAASAAYAGSAATTVVVVGRESVGKSQLIASLTGSRAYSSNFRGSTVTCDEYCCGSHRFVDTPGLFRASDSATARAALERLDRSDVVLLVVQATHLDDDLAELLPLVGGRRGAIVATFRDRVEAGPADAALDRLARAMAVPIVAVDARRLGEADRDRIAAALREAAPLPSTPPAERVGWRISPRATWIEHRRAGWALGALLLLLPALLAVCGANTLAGVVEPLVERMTAPLMAGAARLPAALAEPLAGDYGLLAMGPLLLVWAVPTVVLYALLLGAYRASGLLDRISVAMHPLMRPIGLTGRDLVRVVMGFGCNVPAVIATRACSSCSRGACVSAIAFGSACSYQLGATLGVFTAAGMPGLVVPYLLFLLVTTLLYARLVSTPAARSPLNVLLVEGRTFLVIPRPSAVWREAAGTLEQFFRQAIPIFLLITLVASLLHALGAVRALAGVLAPTMGLFHLPADAAVPILLASVRKDGILLFAEPGLVATLSPLQVLTGVYLAGVLLPCLVTALTIAREVSWRFAGGLLLRQLCAAVVFAIVLARGGGLLFRP